MVITEFCPLKKRAVLNEQTPLRNLNVAKQKEKRTHAYALKLVLLILFHH